VVIDGDARPDLLVAVRAEVRRFNASIDPDDVRIVRLEVLKAAFAV
jgi:hypothetical protein